MAWGRGGAGNLLQAQEEFKRETKRGAEDIEAQQSPATATTGANADETSRSTSEAATTIPSQYATSGRGGAGNWYSPRELTEKGTFSSTNPSSTTAPTSARAATSAELPSARTGRGGAGNFVWDTEREHEEELARKREEEEKVKAQAALDVERDLAKPPGAFLKADSFKS